MRPITCRILAIGNELLIGETVDTNSAAMSRHLSGLGVTVTAKQCLPDIAKEIIQAVRTAQEDILLLTGGLGPTPDDLTRDALAQAFDVKLKTDPRQVGRIRSFFKRFKRKMAPCNLTQALVPEGFSALNNDFGTAPVLFRSKPFIAALPGVPRELEKLMPGLIVPLIQKHFKCPKLYFREIKTSGIGESSLYDRIRHLPIPEGVVFASLPELSGVTLRLSGRKKKVIAILAEKMARCVSEKVFGYAGDTLESVVQSLCLKKRIMLATAESCTGGLIASRLTSLSGSSEYFVGGVVSYSNALKETFLNVPPETLQKYGAVSPETARAMVRGIRQTTGADIGVAVTGIAGPGGGTAEKPVGTVFIAVSFGAETVVEKYFFMGDRKAVQERTCAAALFKVFKTLRELR